MTDKALARYWSSHPMVVSRRVEFLNAPMHALTMLETVTLASEAMAAGKPLHETVINVAKLVNMSRNEELRQDVSDADVINIDGMGVVWGARLFGIQVPERVAGCDLMERLFAVCAEKGFRPYLLGAEMYVLEAVVKRLKQEYPALKLAGLHDGYFSPEQEGDIVDDINTSSADCLFVAMPTPRKERFLRRYRDTLKTSFVMGVGGSFDVYGGKVARAPKAIQAIGFEWLYRVLQEPRRLWRRYYDTNLRYTKMLWKAYWRLKRPARDQ